MIERVEVMKNFRSTFLNTCKLVWVFDKKFFVINIFIICIQGVIPAFQIYLFKEIINLLQKNDNCIKIISAYVLLYVFVNFTDEILSTVYSYYNARYDLKFSNYINILMLKKASKMQIEDYENPDIYDVINRAQAQNGSNILTFITGVAEIIKQVIKVVSTISILINFRIWIVLAIIIIPVCKSIVAIYIDREWYKLRINRTKDERKNRYINYLIMTGNAFKEIILYGLAGYLINQYEAKSEIIIDEDKKMQRKIVLLSIVSDFVDGFITGSCFVYIFVLAIKGVILIGNVTAYIECIENIQLGLQEIFDGIGNSIEQSLYIGFLFDFLKIPEKSDEGNVALDEIKSIEIENLSFKYCDKYILKNINLKIKAGESIALIGENGSGKSTLAKIIMGFYTNYEGIIRINGINLKKINKESYYKKIGCVFQDYTRYETSVRENVGFGDTNKVNESESIKKVLNATFMLKKAIEIGGIDTIIGKWFGNKDLSIGEWQRIAISRALFKDADIYIFDEPDASLDILKQEELSVVYRKILKNKIRIFITHKVDYAEKVATRIVVLENGCITEDGSHEELMKKRGKYYFMYWKCAKV